VGFLISVRNQKIPLKIKEKGGHSVRQFLGLIFSPNQLKPFKINEFY